VLNLRQCYEAKYLICHSLSFSPTKGLGFTVSILPWRNGAPPIQVLTEVIIVRFFIKGQYMSKRLNSTGLNTSVWACFEQLWPSCSKQYKTWRHGPTWCWLAGIQATLSKLSAPVARRSWAGCWLFKANTCPRDSNSTQLNYSVELSLFDMYWA
jgi:hypothetical protein